jgi:hypothetical protein
MMRLLAIARNAFVETIRQPIFHVLILVTYAMLALDLPLSGWTMGRGAAEYKETDQTMLVNLGLSSLLVTGLFLAAFAASGVVSREIEDRTILTVVAKPVSRATIVLGKYLGVSGALATAFYLGALVFIMTVRHGVMPTASDPIDYPVIVLGCAGLALALAGALFFNYFFAWNFASTVLWAQLIFLTLALALISFIGKGWVLIPPFQGIPANLPPAILLTLLCVLVFSAVAVAASTRLGQVLTLLVCIGFFFLGSLTQFAFGQFSANAAARLANWVWPDLTLFYALDAIVRNRPIPYDYVGLVAAYAVCCITAILAIGMALFQRRELYATENASSAPPVVSVIAWLARGLALIMGVAAVVLPAGAMNAHMLGVAAILAVAATTCWLLGGWFGRGVRWTYFVTMLALLAGGIGGLACILTGKSVLGMDKPLLIAASALAAIVLGLLLLPRARDHFGLAHKA